MHIVLIEGYNWKEKVIIIALENENDIHFETIFLAKTTLILKRKEYYHQLINVQYKIRIKNTMTSSRTSRPN